MEKALKLESIDAAVNKFQPVTPDHPFYVNFDDVRGDFKSKELMQILNVRVQQSSYTFNYLPNQHNKTLLFLAGMRGSGKTSELAKYARLLHSPECFFVVTCNVDEELDMDNIQYMDILIFQLEQLLKQADKANLKISDTILSAMQKWFESRVTEINRSLKVDSAAELEIGNDDSYSVTGLLGKLVGLTVKLKTGLSGSVQRAQTIRQNLQNRFVDFSTQFNTFIEQVNAQLRRENKGKEVLFIVDGLEKTMSADTRRRIIMEESNRIRQIQANTIFTLPLELMREQQRIRQFAEVISFPFIKIKERDGSPCERPIALLESFVSKRIDDSLFENKATVRLAIEYSGGSPRQLLRILEQAGWLTSPEDGLITYATLKKAIDRLGNGMARYLEPNDFEQLKALRTELDAGTPIGFSDAIQNLLEKEIVFEYNDGTYKRVNPLLEESKLYRYHVLGDGN